MSATWNRPGNGSKNKHNCFGKWAIATRPTSDHLFETARVAALPLNCSQRPHICNTRQRQVLQLMLAQAIH